MTTQPRDEELDALEREIGSEIYHTDDPNTQRILKEAADAIRALRARLAVPLPAEVARLAAALEPPDWPPGAIALARDDCAEAACMDPRPQGNGGAMTDRELDAVVSAAVDKFLAWKLPADFSPDCGISFTPNYNQHTPWPAKHEPVGTNLFTAEQARAMFVHCLSDAIEHRVPLPAEVECLAEWLESFSHSLFPIAAKNTNSAAARLRSLATRIAELSEQLDSVRAALTELVACKDLKDTAKAMNAKARGRPGKVRSNMLLEYQRRQPIAWGAARAAIKEQTK